MKQISKKQLEKLNGGQEENNTPSLEICPIHAIGYSKDLCCPKCDYIIK